MTGSAVAAPDRPTLVSFVAPGPHSGRTSLVANLAWLIASAGHDVLVLDWDPHGPAVHEYLRPFLIGEGAVTRFLDADLARVVGAAMSVRGRSGRPGLEPQLRRYIGAGPAAGARLDVVRPAGGPDGGGPEDDSLAALLDLRRHLAGAGYRFVLIDGPSVGRATASRDGLLADTVVVCFQPDREASEAAAVLALEIARRSPVRINVISAPGFFDDSDPTRAQDRAYEMRSGLLRTFRAAGTRLDPASLVQVPIPLYSLPHALVALAYEAPAHQSLLDAYRQLVTAVSGGVVDRLPTVPRLVRLVYARHLEGGAAVDHPVEGRTAVDHPIDVVYHPADRPWAEWARARLAGLGLPATLRRVGDSLAESAGARVVVLSERSCAVVEAAGSFGPDTVILRTDATFGQPPPSGVRVVDIVGCSPADARRRFQAALAGSSEVGSGTGPDGRLPGRRPARIDLPPPDPGLVDRGSEMESLRDRLPPGSPSRVVLHGAAATGKTELAKAFAARFGYGYDTVWYIQGRTRQAARAGLRRLGEALGVAATGDKAAAALQQLREDGKPYLLIYDDVDSVDTVGELLPPPDTGHVIVILAGGQPPKPAGTALEVGPLTTDEAMETLGRQLPAFRFADLGSVVEAVGTAPLTLRLTAGCLGVAAAAVETAGRPVAEEAAATVEIFVGTVVAAAPTGRRLPAVGRILLDLLGRTDEGRLLVALSTMCAFLSPDGVSLRLLRSTALLDRLIDLAGESAASLAQDTAEIEYTLASGARAALFAVDWGSAERLRMHRGVQQMIHELLGDVERDRARATTQAALAAYAPSDALHLARGGAAELRELAAHLGPSGALEQTSSVAVRRWVVMQIAFAATGTDPDEWADAAATAEKVLVRWSSGGPDRLSSRLATHRADLIRRLGRDAESLAVDADNLAGLQTMLGAAHLRTAISRRGTAGDLRGLGLFAQARAEDVSVYRTFRTLLGPDHPQTLIALHNLALSNYLDGRQEDAAERESEVLQRRERLFGPDDFMTWWSALDLGVYRRELGRLAQAREILTRSKDRLSELRGDEDPLTLRATVALGVTLRRIATDAGESASIGQARGVIGQAAATLEQVLGSGALATQAARMSLATDLAFNGGDLVDAIKVAGEALEVYERRLTAYHPFVALCRVNLAALLRQNGHFEKAAENVSDALTILDERFPSTHPWKLAARINLGNILLCQSRWNDAQVLLRTAWEAAEGVLPKGHPYLKLLRGSMMNVDVLRAGAARGEPLDGLTDVDVEIPTT